MMSVSQMEDVADVDVVVKSFLYQVLGFEARQLCHPGVGEQMKYLDI